MGIQALNIGDDGTVLGATIKLPADTSIGGSSVAALGTITSASATAFAVGRQGATFPVLNVAANAALVVTGVNLVGGAAAAGLGIVVTSSGTNESLTIDAKGSGTILLNGTATGAVLVGDATNPALSVVHTTEGTGIGITSAAAASGVALAALSSGTDENLTINAKGAGTVTINGTATGAVVIGNLRAKSAITVASVDGAITVASGTVAITKGSAGAYSIAAPSSQNGTEITFVSTTDFAHILTFTGGTLLDGTTGANTTATFPAFAGAAITVVAYGTVWLVKSVNAVVIAP